jgi:small neutral amino acid transporter SnatA (MarC family)
MDGDTQQKVARRMVQTAVTTALILAVLGWFLMRLLHFTPGAANIAGGIVLLLLALHMLTSPGKDDHHEKAGGRDAMQMALYPLAVPYLLNPAGIAAIVIRGGPGLVDIQKHGQAGQAPGPLEVGRDRGSVWRPAGCAGRATDAGWPG